MTIERTSWIAAGLMILFSANVFAELPRFCFKSDKDYELAAGRAGNVGYYEIQYKAIQFVVSQTQSGGKIIADASGSTTPSGEKIFAWGSSDIVSTTAQYSTTAGSPGSYSNIRLTIRDPVCQLKTATQVRVTSQ